MWWPSRTATLCVCGLLAALTAVGAYIRIPLGHVPITLQTLFVLLCGSLLSPGFAAATQGAYLACGLVGLPVFASGGGAGSVLHPTFGYLASFPLASFVTAIIVRMRPKGASQSLAYTLTWKRLTLANLIGALIILTVGVGYLYVNLNLISGGGISLRSAVWVGAVIFVPGELVKVFLVVATVRRVLSVARLKYNPRMEERVS